METDQAQTAIKKRRDGEKLTPEEEQAYKQYFQKYSQRAAKIYFRSPEELAEYQATAKENNYPTFSKWVLEQIETAATGRMYDPEYVNDLRAEVEATREKLERERDETEHYRTRARELEEKLQEYADEFFRIAAAKGD